jgi:hypothetical protein
VILKLEVALRPPHPFSDIRSCSYPNKKDKKAFVLGRFHHATVFGGYIVREFEYINARQIVKKTMGGSELVQLER